MYYCNSTGDIAKKIVGYLLDYQNHIQNLTEDGHNIVGYVRKSPGTEEDKECHIRLLQIMCDRLRERSLVDHVFTSVRCRARDPIVERDLMKHEESLAELHVDGDIQGK
jgi:hypothetical protein